MAVSITSASFSREKHGSLPFVMSEGCSTRSNRDSVFVWFLLFLFFTLQIEKCDTERNKYATFCISFDFFFFFFVTHDAAKKIINKIHKLVPNRTKNLKL